MRTEPGFPFSAPLRWPHCSPALSHRLPVPRMDSPSGCLPTLLLSVLCRCSMARLRHNNSDHSNPFPIHPPPSDTKPSRKTRPHKGHHPFHITHGARLASASDSPELPRRRRGSSAVRFQRPPSSQPRLGTHLAQNTYTYMPPATNSPTPRKWRNFSQVKYALWSYQLSLAPPPAPTALPVAPPARPCILP